MKWLEINGTNPLKGNISIPGSKNSSLGLLAASCLASDPICLKNIPNISDVHVTLSILENIGVTLRKPDPYTIILDPSNIHTSIIDPNKSSLFRTAYYFIGALLGKFKKVSVGYPGGDNLGSRPIDQHIKGFQALGAKFTFYENHYTVTADELIGKEIFFDTITSGATINLMLAAVFAKGKTILYNAAKDPEIVDIAIFLNKMGARIFGAGTNTIRIEGVTSLKGCTHSVIPDRLIAGSFLIAAGVTNGEISVTNMVPEHLESLTEKLTEIGMGLEIKDDSITAYGISNIKPVQIKTGMYPIFPTDFQQPITALLLKANGKSTIYDSIYPERFKHCDQLTRMGADITVRHGMASINNHSSLKGALVHATDIRSGMCLILASMLAKGTTYITGIEHIERGYENIIASFNALGANIRLCEDTIHPKEMELKSVLKNIPIIS